MNRAGGLFFGIALILIAGCTAPADDEAVPPASESVAASEEPDLKVGAEMDPTDRVEDSCNSDRLSDWLGKQADDLPDGLLAERDRILAPDGMATMDYVPERLNVLTDDEGMIIGFKCG